MFKNENSIDVFGLKTAPMPAVGLIWIAFSSGFFAWFACLPLVPAMQGGFSLQQTLLPIGALLAASAICTTAVRRAPARPNRTPHH